MLFLNQKKMILNSLLMSNCLKSCQMQVFGFATFQKKYRTVQDFKAGLELKGDLPWHWISTHLSNETFLLHNKSKNSLYMHCNCSMTQAALIKCYGNLILKPSPTFLSLRFVSYWVPFNRKGFRMSHALAFLIKMSSLRVYLHTQNSCLCLLLCARSWHHSCCLNSWSSPNCSSSELQPGPRPRSPERNWAWGNRMDPQTSLYLSTRDSLAQLKAACCVASGDFIPHLRTRGWYHRVWFSMAQGCDTVV